MHTRARAAAKQPAKKIKVILQLRPSGEAYEISEVDGYRQAMDIAANSGKIPEGWNIAITESTPQRIIVGCQNGHIDVPDSYELVKPKAAPTTPAVTPPKPKAKRVPLPDKLAREGTGTEQVFRPKTAIDLVAGNVGEIYLKEHYKTCRPRQADFVVRSIEVKVQVVGQPEREVAVRKDDRNIFEILGRAFELEESSADDRLNLLTKPFKMEDDAVFKFERIRTTVKMILGYTTWDNTLYQKGRNTPF
jgi:hypothetical protein